MSSLAVQIRQEKCTAVTKISRNSRLLFPANISLVKRLVDQSPSARLCGDLRFRGSEWSFVPRDNLTRVGFPRH